MNKLTVVGVLGFVVLMGNSVFGQDEAELKKEKILYNEKVEKEEKNLKYEKLKAVEEDKISREKALRKKKVIREQALEDAVVGDKMMRQEIMDDKMARDKELRRIEAEIAALNDKLEQAIVHERRVLLKKRLQALMERREHILHNLPPAPVEPPPPFVEPKPPIMHKRSLEPQIGLAGGLFAATPALLGEIRFFDPFDLISTSLRLGGMYAQGSSRKHALVFIDWIYRLNPPGTPGINSYVGLGANYNVYTTGRVSGAAGYQAFYGVEGDSGSGRLYLEAGYGTLRTGFSPDSQGYNVMLGFRM